jgi:hypothetical protein
VGIVQEAKTVGGGSAFTIGDLCRKVVLNTSLTERPAREWLRQFPKRSAPMRLPDYADRAYAKRNRKDTPTAGYRQKIISYKALSFCKNSYSRIAAAHKMNILPEANGQDKAALRISVEKAAIVVDRGKNVARPASGIRSAKTRW